MMVLGGTQSEPASPPRGGRCAPPSCHASAMASVAPSCHSSQAVSGVATPQSRATSRRPSVNHNKAMPPPRPPSAAGGPVVGPPARHTAPHPLTSHTDEEGAPGQGSSLHDDDDDDDDERIPTARAASYVSGDAPSKPPQLLRPKGGTPAMLRPERGSHDRASRPSELWAPSQRRASSGTFASASSTNADQTHTDGQGLPF